MQVKRLASCMSFLKKVGLLILQHDRLFCRCQKWVYWVSQMSNFRSSNDRRFSESGVTAAESVKGGGG